MADGLLTKFAGCTAKLAVCGSLVVLAACGSSSTSSSTASSTSAPTTTTTSASTSAGAGATVDAAFAAKAGAICADGTAKIAAIKQPGDPTKATAADLPAWSHYFSQVLPIFASAVQQLQGAGLPSQAVAEYGAAATKSALALADLQKLAAAAQAGDLATYEGQLLVYGQDHLAANAAFDAIGLQQCGSGTNAATSSSS